MFLSLRELVNLSFLLFATKKNQTLLLVHPFVLTEALSAMIGAVCVGPGAAGMPLLETWGSAVHVLSHPSSEKTVDKEKQGHILKGEHIEALDQRCPHQVKKIYLL